MNTYVALFRGINVGGKNILPMKALVGTFEGMGLKKVQSYIQSGNVVFQTTKDRPEKLAEDIRAAVGKGHDIVPQVLVLSIQEFRNAIASNPFPAGENEPKSLHLFFLKTRPAKPDMERLALLQSAKERFKLVGAVFYLHAPEGIGRSKLAANVEKALGVAVTARNWRSVSAILSLAMEVAS